MTISFVSCPILNNSPMNPTKLTSCVLVKFGLDVVPIPKHELSNRFCKQFRKLIRSFFPIEFDSKLFKIIQK
jgi:hypothetical protein